MNTETLGLLEAGKERELKEKQQVRRDMFAAAALTGMLANSEFSEQLITDYAIDVRELSDAVMRELDK